MGPHFLRPLAEHSYQSYLKYLEEKWTHRRLKRKIALDMCKHGWALHYVVIKVNDGVQFNLMAKVLAVRTFNRPNNRLYANSNGYAIHNKKGDQVSTIAAIWAIYHHMSMGPPEESGESQPYCPTGDKTWCKYHKDKIFNRNIYIWSIKMFTICVSRRASCQRALTQNQNESINNMIWLKCPKRVYVADLLFLFVNEIKWGGHME